MTDPPTASVWAKSAASRNHWHTPRYQGTKGQKMTLAYLTRSDAWRLANGDRSKLRPLIVSAPLHKLMIKPIRIADVNREIARLGY